MPQSIGSITPHEKVYRRADPALGGVRVDDPEKAAVHIGETFAHSRELFGRHHRIVDSDRSAFMLTSNQCRERAMHALGAGLDKATAQFGFMLYFRRDPLLESHHLGPGQKGNQGFAERG